MTGNRTGELNGHGGEGTVRDKVISQFQQISGACDGLVVAELVLGLFGIIQPDWAVTR